MATLRATTAAGKDVRLVLVRKPGGTVRFNRDGSTESTETFSCLYSRALQLAPVRGETPHPVFTALICKECTVTEVEAGMAEVVATYIGDASDSVGVIGSARLPSPTYELICEAREEPITTFPDFATTIGTTANGAQFDSNNLFLGFDKTSAYVGQEAWLVPGVVWRKSYIQKTKPTATELNRVGKIDTPEGSPPAATSPRNWLLRSLTFTLEGNLYRCQKEWHLSGPSGWNATIYAP